MNLHLTTHNAARTLPVGNITEAETLAEADADVVYAIFDDGEFDYIVKTLTPDVGWERYTLTLTPDRPLSVNPEMDDPQPEAEEHVFFAVNRDHALTIAHHLIGDRGFWDMVLLDEEGEDLPL